ncbi:MAG: hypothetical protein EXS12_02990 [Phycisphaerales bacterium]|nr:hypothetical protein [Phycisphaerales bacterium]
MRNRVIASVFNRFSLSVVAVMFGLGVYAILASSTMAWKALGTMLVVIIGLFFARLHFWLWTRAPWRKLFAASSWLCNLFLVSVSISSIWNWSRWFNLDAVGMDKPVICALVFIGAVTDCMLLLRLRFAKTLDRCIRAVAVGLAIVGALLIMAAEVSQRFQDFFNAIWIVIPWQLGAIVGLIAVASHAASAILASIEKEKSSKLLETFSERMKVSMNCPRCGDLIKLTLGHSVCSNCKLAIHIECDEPRCECGYLLHKLTGVNCPECGKEVVEKLRWKSAQQSSPSITAAS